MMYMIQAAYLIFQQKVIMNLSYVYIGLSNYCIISYCIDLVHLNMRAHLLNNNVRQQIKGVSAATNEISTNVRNAKWNISTCEVANESIFLLTRCQ